MRKIDWQNKFDFSDYHHRCNLEDCKNFTYGHFKVGAGFATVAAGRIDDYLYYGITFCSPEDNFSRQKGRSYACRNLREESHSHMRGVLTLEGAVDEAPPAIVLKKAVENHLRKMRPDQRPQWAKGAAIDFRSMKRNVGEVANYQLME